MTVSVSALLPYLRADANQNPNQNPP